MSRRRRNSHTLSTSGVQALEDRQLKTGNVTVELSAADSGDVIIEGDDSDNFILITEVDAHHIRVSGLFRPQDTSNGSYSNRGYADRTLINGGTSSVTLRVTDDVRIRMGGGNDEVTIRDLNLVNRDHSDLMIDLGDGNDRLETDSVDVRRLMDVDGGNGRDELIVSETTAHVLKVDGEYGNDTLLLDEVTTGNDVVVDGGEGVDTITIRDSVAGDDLRITGDAGNDHIQVDGVGVVDDLVVDGGSSDDVINVAESHADDILVYGGSGDDSVSVRDNQITDLLFVDLGTGDDSLDFLSNQVGRHSFNGGPGNDIWFSTEFWWSWRNFWNF